MVYLLLCSTSNIFANIKSIEQIQNKLNAEFEKIMEFDMGKIFGRHKFLNLEYVHILMKTKTIMYKTWNVHVCLKEIVIYMYKLHQQSK